MFLHVSVILSMGGPCMVAWGECVVAPGGWGACVVALGFRGACVIPPGGGMCGCSRGGGVHGCSGGHAWLLQGVLLIQGGVHGCSSGACMVAWGCVCGWFGGHAWLLRGGMCGCSGVGQWDTTRYRDMINERAVRILLECILVDVIVGGA